MPSNTLGGALACRAAKMSIASRIITINAFISFLLSSAFVRETVPAGEPKNPLVPNSKKWGVKFDRETDVHR